MAFRYHQNSLSSPQAATAGQWISRVTDAVLDEVREWQSRALERMYPIVIFDALRVKIRDAPSRDIATQCTAGQWTAAWSKTRLFMWLWASPGTACARFSAFGLTANSSIRLPANRSLTMKVPNPGCR